MRLISMISSKVSSKKELQPVDKIIYELGLVALGISFAAVLLYILTGFNVLRLGFTCMFNKLTDLPCPGCGGTRSLRALLRGDVLLSMYLYFPVPYMIVVYVIFMTRCFMYKYFGAKKSANGTIVKYIYIFIGLIALQWVVKLVAQIGYGYYWLLSYDRIFGHL